MAIEDNADGTWDRSQFDLASKIVKRNFKLVNLLGDTVWEQHNYHTRTGTGKSGSGNNIQAPVTICASNVHARETIPRPPVSFKLELTDDTLDIFNFGNTVLWPRGE